VPEATLAAAPATRGARTGGWNRFLVLGCTVLALFVVLAVFGPWIAPHDPDTQDLLSLLQPPDATHWFGTDQVGRDILSRLIVGTRVTLTVALVPVALAGVAGVALGLTAGYFGGVVDRVLTACIDLLLTIPSLILAIAMVTAVGANLTGLTAAITISATPPLARLVRGRVQELREEDYIAAAVSVGMRQRRVLLRHVLPNAASVIVIQLSLLAGQAVLVASALGFLGLGVQPPTPEWGAMLGESREYIQVAPHVVIAPGIAIALLVFAFNMLGDGLRDMFDPNQT
jgi:ABC-type dipeptide/oligopeptide/nickel transport system permease subunit